MRRFVGERRLVPSTLRGHLTRTGDAKVKFTSQETARRVAAKHHKGCYPCKVCGCWHIGGSESLTNS